jgi:E3 ubiquitin-protein ligase SHPRH
LIVTPVSLATQWKDELEKHAPTLKVLFYDGWTKLAVPFHANRRSPLEEKEKVEAKKAKSKGKAKVKAEEDAAAPTKKSVKAAQKAAEKEKENEMARGPDGKLLHWCEYVHQFDVVITTYNVLRSEIHVARPGPDRPRREDSAYSKDGRLRSPLVMVEWKRVVMDEVQMVGGGNAAEMVSLVPRSSSFAVSGTPAKSQVSDLINVLKYELALPMFQPPADRFSQIPSGG